MRNGTLLICVFCSMVLCLGCEGSKKSSPDSSKDSPTKSQTKTGKFGSGKTDNSKIEQVTKGQDTKGNEKQTGDSRGSKSNADSDKRLPDVAPTTTSEPIASLDVAGLINCLGDADSAKRLEAAQRLVALGAPSIAELREALQAENYHIRAGAAFALGLCGSQAKDAAVDLQHLSKNDEREAVRSAAAFALDATQNATKKAD